MYVMYVGYVCMCGKVCMHVMSIMYARMYALSVFCHVCTHVRTYVMYVMQVQHVCMYVRLLKCMFDMFV